MGSGKGEWGVALAGVPVSAALGMWGLVCPLFDLLSNNDTAGSGEKKLRPN